MQIGTRSTGNEKDGFREFEVQVTGPMSRDVTLSQLDYLGDAIAGELGLVGHDLGTKPAITPTRNYTKITLSIRVSENSVNVVLGQLQLLFVSSLRATLEKLHPGAV